MSLQQFETVDNPVPPHPAGVPDPENIPLRILHIAALRGLGFPLRAIGRNYGVSPQAVALMLARYKSVLRTARHRSEIDGLSPRAVNILGRLGIKTRAEARAAGDLAERLHGLRNCGRKTVAEIRDWAAGGFTLVELLVVIAIVAILAAVATPAVWSARSKAHTAEATAHLRSIGAANQMHAAENNGLIAGEGNSRAKFPQSPSGSGSYGRLFPYMSSRGRPARDWNELIGFWTPLRDPAVPRELAKDDNWPMTWAWNELFNMDWGPGRRMIQFAQPGKVLYAVTGRGEFVPSMASNPGQQQIPQARRDGFYFIHNGKCPAVFLDGRVELLAFPIDPKMIRPF